MNYFDLLNSKPIDAEKSILVKKLDCPIHGETDHYQVLNLKPVCRRCEADRLKANHRESVQKLAEGYLEVMGYNGINSAGKRFNEWNFGADDALKNRQAKIIAVLENIAAKFNIKSGAKNATLPNILLLGPTGSGKTMLANALAKDVYRRVLADDVAKKDFSGARTVVRLIRSHDLTKRAIASWRGNEITEFELLARLGSVPLLIVDDVGDSDTAANKDMAEKDRGRLAQILDMRYKKQPTIITSNLTLDALIAHLGDRGWDRLQENLIVIECDWLSYRKQVAKIAKL